MSVLPDKGPAIPLVLEVERRARLMPCSDDGPGRMTGGGSVFTAEDGRVTHGFTLHCDPAAGPNRLQVNWRESGSRNTFHLESLTSAFCTDDPTIDEGNPIAGFDTYHGIGTGRLNGVSGATISFTFTDAGEPGKGVDLATMSINGGAALVVSDTLQKGNHQAHEGIGALLPAAGARGRGRGNGMIIGAP